MYMDRAIFDLNASVGATSLYILICALLDQGEEHMTLDRAMVQWNGTWEELHTAALELIRRGVLSTSDSESEMGPLHVNSREKWC